MKSKFYIFCLLGSLLLGGCVRDPITDGMQREGEAMVTLAFGDTSFEHVQINTRATLGTGAESRVMNLYVFIFDAAGRRRYGYYFDRDNQQDSEAAARNGDTNCWWVRNYTESDGDYDVKKPNAHTHGVIRMKAPLLENGRMYIISNINADMLNISPEKLDQVQAEQDLLAMTAKLNQLVTSRNGSFSMSGMADDVDIIGNDQMTIGGDATARIPLTRMDAKVEVRIRVSSEPITSVDPNNPDNTMVSKIKQFVPSSWQVINLPESSFIVANANDANGGFFDSREVVFEDLWNESEAERPAGTSGQVNGFSFYMLENGPKCKKSVNGIYRLRDRRIKNADGTYNTANGMWEYAPETGTYLIIKGDVEMNVDTSLEGQQQLTAEVVYYVHLGNIKSSMDDYEVKRNTHYIYNITIKGVDKIQLEVETKTQEDESGAMGHVYIAKESVYTFDAHYGQRVFSFDQAFIDPDVVTWYVKTPFGREGRPDKIGDVEVPNGLDYKWVKFVVNDRTDSGYSVNNRSYPGEDQVMDVLEFSSYIKEQKRRFDESPGDLSYHDFRPHYDASFPEGQQTRWRIYVTVFVDEYYYDSDPITGEVRPQLWKEFVNKTNRVMHLLSDSQVSADGDSSVTGSIVTIRQRPIMTIYNVESANVSTAWGSESIDETGPVEGDDSFLWYYSRKERLTSDGNNDVILGGKVPNQYNTSQDNGLYNTARIWSLVSGNAYVSKPWKDFLDYDRPNDYRDAGGTGHNIVFLRDEDEIATARYSCLMRNRDNNGNGRIDADEIRWYLASINQLTALYMGDQGLEKEARLYPPTKALEPNVKDADGFWPWRVHIISSTSSADAEQGPVILWAEEGISTGAYFAPWSHGNGANHKPARYSIRCVRNLGMDPANEVEAQQNLMNASHIPDRSITVVAPTGPVTSNSVYTFDLSALNVESIRPYVLEKDLITSDETGQDSWLYSKFETGPVADKTYTYQELKEALDRGISVCPEDYRVPNIREATLMANYIPSSSAWWNGGKTFLCTTWYSFGLFGSRYDTSVNDQGAVINAVSWVCDPSYIWIVTTEEGRHIVRCVRDVVE